MNYTTKIKNILNGDRIVDMIVLDYFIIILTNHDNKIIFALHQHETIFFGIGHKIHIIITHFQNICK